MRLRIIAAKHRLQHRTWRTLDALAYPWRSLDRWTRGAHDLMLDLGLGSLRSSLGRYYAQGWGNVDVPATFHAWLNTFASKSRGLPATEPMVAVEDWLPRRIAVRLGPAHVHAPGVVVRQGTFDTSALEIKELLPPESHVAHVAYVAPAAPLAAAERSTPIVVLLPGTGEHGFGRRMAFAAVPLARLGVASLILESPYYGIRKPADQRGSKLKHVSDLTVLGRTTIEESCSLLQWAAEELGHVNASVAGVSMGGLHAAMVASLHASPVGIVSFLGPPSAAPVFTQGLLSRFIEWRRLQSDLPDDVDAKDVMNRFLALTDIGNFPAPCAPERAVFVVAERDCYVPAHVSKSVFYEMCKDRWQGARLFVVPGGHVSATLFGGQFFRDAIEFSLGRTGDLKWT